MSTEPPVDLALACTSCGRSIELRLRPDTRSVACPSCAAEIALPEAGDVAVAGRVQACPVCGGKDFYSQRDFSRPLGLTLAAIGLLLGPWTHWISVGVAVALDAILYMIVPNLVVCYACNAQFRGIAKEKAAPGFEIAIHDAYKFGKRFPPRRTAAVAGPLQSRLRSESGQSDLRPPAP